MSCRKMIHPDVVAVRSKIRKAFAILRKAGYFARQNFWCCQTCAWADIPESFQNAVFYHHQDNDDLRAKASVFLAWRSENPSFIVDTMKSVGLKVDWDGTEGQRMFVHQ